MIPDCYKLLDLSIGFYCTQCGEDKPASVSCIHCGQCHCNVCAEKPCPYCGGLPK